MEEVHSEMKAVGNVEVDIAVGETGWPQFVMVGMLVVWLMLRVIMDSWLGIWKKGKGHH
jgi:hypothetical protein